MEGVSCPFTGCTYRTPDATEPAMDAVLMSTHAMEHQLQRSMKAKPTPVKRPEMTSAGTTENWTYFLTRWRSYSRAVRQASQDLVIQLLECCDNKLRRDMTRNTDRPNCPGGHDRSQCPEGDEVLSRERIEPESGQGGPQQDEPRQGRTHQSLRSQTQGPGRGVQIHQGLYRMRHHLQPGGGESGRPTVHRAGR